MTQTGGIQFKYLGEEQYKIAVVDPSNGNIVEWRDAVMMQVKSKVKGQEGNGETTQVAWDIKYKKRLA